MTITATFWDKRAAKYAKSRIQNMDGYNAGLDRIKAHLKADMSVLELGCGTGMTALKLAPSVRQYTGTDVSEGMIAECDKRLMATNVQNVDFRTGTVFDTPQPDGKWDAVIALNLLHLLPDLPETMAQVADMLPQGGVFISKTVCAPTSALRLKFRAMMAMARVYQWFNPGLYVNMRPVHALEQVIQDAGFELIETGNYPAQPITRLIVARKL